MPTRQKRGRGRQARPERLRLLARRLRALVRPDPARPPRPPPLPLLRRRPGGRRLDVA